MWIQVDYGTLRNALACSKGSHGFDADVAIKSQMRRGAQEQMQLFRKHLAESAELTRRLRDSARADFYATVRRHLRGEPVPPESPVLVPSPSTACDILTPEVDHAAVVLCKMQMTEILGGSEPWQIGWEWATLSTKLPHDWADRTD